jgi:hypothetical protein
MKDSSDTMIGTDEEITTTGVIQVHLEVPQEEPTDEEILTTGVAQVRLELPRRVQTPVVAPVKAESREYNMEIVTISEEQNRTQLMLLRVAIKLIKLRA